MEEEPTRKNPKLEEMRDESLSRFLEIPILVKKLTEFLPLKDQLVLLQTSSEWQRAIKVSLGQTRTISNYDHFLATDWPRDALSSVLGRRQILAKQILWLVGNMPHLAEIRDLTWCLRAEDPLLIGQLRQLETFQALTSLHISSGTLQAHQLDQFLSSIGGQLDSLVLTGRLRRQKGSPTFLPGSFCFLSELTHLQISNDFLRLVADLPSLEILKTLKCELCLPNDIVYPDGVLMGFWSQILPRCRRLQELQMELPKPLVQDEFWQTWALETPVLEQLSCLKTLMKPQFLSINDKVVSSLLSKFPSLSHLEFMHYFTIGKETSLDISLHNHGWGFNNAYNVAFFVPKQVDLRHFRMKNFKFPNGLADLIRFSNLRVLELSSCMVDWSAGVGRAFAHFPHLTRLALTDVWLFRLGREDLVQLLISSLSTGCASLFLDVKVDMQEDRLRDSDWEAILSARGAQFLELGLGRSEISAVTVAEICRSCTALERLELMEGDEPGLKKLVQGQLPAMVAHIHVFVDGVDLRAPEVLDRLDQHHSHLLD